MDCPRNMQFALCRKCPCAQLMRTDNISPVLLTTDVSHALLSRCWSPSRPSSYHNSQMDKAPRAHVAGAMNGRKVYRPPDAYPGMLNCRGQPIGFLQPWWQTGGLPPRASYGASTRLEGRVPPTADALSRRCAPEQAGSSRIFGSRNAHSSRIALFALGLVFYSPAAQHPRGFEVALFVLCRAPDHHCPTRPARCIAACICLA